MLGRPTASGARSQNRHGAGRDVGRSGRRVGRRAVADGEPGPEASAEQTGQRPQAVAAAATAVTLPTIQAWARKAAEPVVARAGTPCKTARNEPGNELAGSLPATMSRSPVQNHAP